ncbi:HPP family protein [Neisseria sicca]|uniref:HPP family protein n=1 Tax=Neisseria sicca TaxID=490 RepID=UPI0028FC2050|nr:HPP family protein [Neisseria sicca]
MGGRAAEIRWLRDRYCPKSAGRARWLGWWRCGWAWRGLLCMVFLIVGWDFLVMPTLTGSLILVAVALVYNHLGKGRRYPTYWL